MQKYKYTCRENYPIPKLPGNKLFEKQLFYLSEIQIPGESCSGKSCSMFIYLKQSDGLHVH